MVERRYTVKEIDHLRSVCKDLWSFGPEIFMPLDKKEYNLIQGRFWRGSERDVAVEELVRTYMLAGLTGQDIIDSYKE